jgi:cephalosporin hydroxylase
MNTYWLGIPLFKNPLDLWVYQELISDLMPDWIIESGTYRGGSALYLASICDLVGKGEVITIDIENVEACPTHDRLIHLKGSSTSKEIVERVLNLIEKDNKVMVILDSCHEMSHVINELRIYSKFVTKGSYLIVEDSNVNGHPVYPNFGPGPMEAIKEFLQENNDFVIDRSKEKHFLTFNPKGYLKRVG